MGCKATVLALIVAGIAGYLGYSVNQSLNYIPPLPELEDTWWGPKTSKPEDTSIKPFKINVPDEVLKDLQTRLANTRPVTPSLEGAAQHYGMNEKLLNSIVDFWRTKYNWREREKFLNQFPQFKVSVQGLNIHYIHVKPTKTEGLKVVPLLLLHGWPGSIREFYEMIPLLTTPQKGRKVIFEVFVPSLPGYGFSDAAVRPGLGAIQAAVLFKNFMRRVGHEKFYLQGGDWGAMIVQHMAVLYPERVLGVHSNMCEVMTPMSNLKMLLYSFYPAGIVSKEKEDKVYPISKVFMNLLLEMGYMHLQSTKPDTVGVALKDSPAGLAAYIIEKFTTWTNPAWKDRDDGGLSEKYSLTNILDNVMIYWVTGSITSSMRFYAETMSKDQYSKQMDSIPVTVPSGCARFENELMYLPEGLIDLKYKNLVQLTDLHGGHFAAFEEPKALANDVYSFIEKVLKL